MESNITAEEFFRKKVKELHPNKKEVTLAGELITAEQGLRWAHEYHELKSGSKSFNKNEGHICVQTGLPCGMPCFDECPIYKEQ